MIASAEELREASEAFREGQEGKSKEDILKGWMKHFEKTVDRAIKDSIRGGASSCSVQLPWQPVNTEEGKKTFVRETKVEGVELRKWVQQQLPGCSIEFVSEEVDGSVKGGDVWFMLEISWSKL